MYFLLGAKQNTSLASTSVENFLTFGAANGANYSTTESARSTVVMAAFDMTNLYIEQNLAPGASASIAYTIRKNGADTALTGTISGAGAGQVVTDTTHTVHFDVGDTISIGLVPTGTPAGPGFLYIRTLCNSTVASSQFISGYLTTASTSVTDYANIFGGQGALNSVEAVQQFVMPCAGSFSNLSLNQGVALAGGGSFTYTLRVNGVSSSLTCQIATGNSFADDLTHSVSVNAGDLVGLMCVPAGTISSSNATNIGIAFTPSFYGDTVIGWSQVGGGGPSTSAKSFNEPSGVGFGYDTTTGNEVNFSLEYGPCTLKAMYINLGTAPASGKSWVFTIRNNLADTSLTTTIANAATTGNASVKVPLQAGDKITLSALPSGTPTAPVTVNGGLCINMDLQSGFMPTFATSSGGD